MQAQVNCPSPERAFIAFLIEYIVDTNPGDLITNVAKITQHLQDNFDPKHELNLHRKQYGNLKDCVKSEATKMVF